MARPGNKGHIGGLTTVTMLDCDGRDEAMKVVMWVFAMEGGEEAGWGQRSRIRLVAPVGRDKAWQRRSHGRFVTTVVPDVGFRDGGLLDFKEGV